MQEKDTKYLETELKQAKNVEEFLCDNGQILNAKTVPEFLNDLLIKYNVEKADVVHRSGLSGTYAYQIFDGKKSAGREKLIQLAFGFPLSLEETQHLLRFGGHAELYVKKRREAFLMYALEKGYSIDQTHALLYYDAAKILE